MPCQHYGRALKESAEDQRGRYHRVDHVRCAGMAMWVSCKGHALTPCLQHCHRQWRQHCHHCYQYKSHSHHYCPPIEASSWSRGTSLSQFSSKLFFSYIFKAMQCWSQRKWESMESMWLIIIMQSDHQLTSADQRLTTEPDDYQIQSTR